MAVDGALFEKIIQMREEDARELIKIACIGAAHNPNIITDQITMLKTACELMGYGMALAGKSGIEVKIILKDPNDPDNVCVYKTD